MFCEIRVRGHLSAPWMEWLDGLSITNEVNGEALIAGRLPDQSALYGVLNRLEALNLPLLSVACAPDSADSPGDSSSDE